MVPGLPGNLLPFYPERKELPMITKWGGLPDYPVLTYEDRSAAEAWG
jgi:hypothetical protein